MFKKISITALIVVIALIVIPYIAIAVDDKPLTEEVKSNAPGQFAKLTDGEIHYLWVEPEKHVANGKIIVMSHGLYYPNFMFTQNAQAFSDAGFKVLLFDHFGHGYSDRPTVDYTPGFFDQEVSELIKAVGIDQPFILIGQSMGGLIATQFTGNHPELVSKLLLFVPAGLKMHGDDDSFGAILLRIPIVRDWVWRVFGRKTITRVQGKPCDICGEGKLLGDGLVQTKYEGYFESMLNILVNFKMRDRDSDYEKLGRNDVPVYAIFGEQDTTVHFDSANRLQKAIPAATVVRLHEGDHALHVRHPEKVNQLILAELTAE